ncbi:lytic transglycosylase domain-containing protein [Rhodobacteraceae bacterium]|nr:lytic transglycosylase domain-containing protein [Paracoccaceae bacterium]
MYLSPLKVGLFAGCVAAGFGGATSALGEAGAINISAGRSAEQQSEPTYPTGPEALHLALQAAAKKNWAQALVLGRDAGPLGFDIVEWHRLRAGEGGFPAYADFARRRADWPGMPLLRRKGEAVLDQASPAEVVAYFKGHAPQTGAGALALIAALQSTGAGTRAAEVAVQAWRDLRLTPEDQAAFLARYEVLVRPYHGARMQRMLDRGELTQARRMLDLVTPGTQAVARARIALQAKDHGVDALIAAVPEYMMGSAGLARDRAVWRWRESYEDGAADLILNWSASAQKLEDPALWSDVRRRMARWDLRHGNIQRAYDQAASHHLDPGSSDYAELEWLAGYAALKLEDAPRALRHFEALSAAVGSPISQSRADYWRGRALVAMGRTQDARQAFTAGAQNQTAFYGLLSAQELGMDLDPALIQPPALPDWRLGQYQDASVFQAAQLLHRSQDTALAERFILHLEEGLPQDQIAPLVDLALEWQDPHLALQLGKRAALNGEILVAGYFPIPALRTHQLGVPEELALSIARRESEFDHTVISYVGARGLMQLMPGTAKMMARKLDVAYEPARLTTDPTYNVELGSAYLQDLRTEFDNSPVLVAAGYNAGPGRPRRWIEEQGDPRNGSVDVVDWVEMIPFDETRNYVMRVAESLPIYRARLGGAQVPFTEELRGHAP